MFIGIFQQVKDRERELTVSTLCVPRVPTMSPTVLGTSRVSVAGRPSVLTGRPRGSGILGTVKAGQDRLAPQSEWTPQLSFSLALQLWVASLLKSTPSTRSLRSLRFGPTRTTSHRPCETVSARTQPTSDHT